MIYTKSTFTAFFLIIQSTFSFAQLVTSNSLTPTQLVQQVLLGSGISVSNITFTGDAKQITKFNASANTNLGFLKGVLMSTGNALTSSINGPQGPNSSSGTSTGFGNMGDTDLDALSGVTTNDAAVLEFDFIPTSDSLRFRYFFGSEEYPEFVGGGVNDAFGFFITGPNPSGGSYTNKNIALIPNTTTPVSINDVNANSNSSYYTSNASNSINCEFDGFTVVLKALEKVMCGATYHIKLAIADGGDDILDSGVFLEEGSFSSSPPIKVSTNNSNANFTDTVMVEDCNTNCIYFIRNANIAQKDSFKLQVNGSAMLGSDYINTVNNNFSWPAQLVFPPGEDTLTFCNLKALEDNITEPLDTIIFTLTSYTNALSACAITNSIKFNLYIKDYNSIKIAQNDSAICNGKTIVLNANASNGVPAYSYNWLPSIVNTPTLNTGSISQLTQFTITVNDICNKPVSKIITLTPTTLPILAAVSDIKFCIDSIKKIELVASNGKPSYTYTWLIPTSGVIPFDTINTTYYFTNTNQASSGTYTVIVTDQCSKSYSTTTTITTVDCRIIVPNVVTPNGDNHNDVFKINGLENFPNSKLYVYNRWGKKVYESVNYKNDWTPEQHDGTYFYTLEITDGRTFKGFFQLFN